MKFGVTFGFGALYGAIRLLIHNIWPLVVLHMLHDLFFGIAGLAGPLQVQSMPLGTEAIIAAGCVIVAILLARNVTDISVR